MRLFSKWRFIGFLLILALVVSGCATDSAYKKRKAESKRDMGERFLMAGKSSLALEQFFEALKLNPDDHFLHYDLARTYDLKGAADKAEYHIKEAVRLKPDFSMAQNYLGVIYARQGKTDLAIAAYEAALKNLLYINPQNSYYNLGLAYLSLKEYDKSVKNFREALALVPDFTAAYNGLGQAYEGLNKAREAKRAYNKAIEFAPEFAEAHLNLAILQFKSGEKKAAINSFREVIRLAPDSDLAGESQAYLKRLK